MVSHMKRATVRDLRNHFAKVARWIEAGESVEVTFRGKPLARMVPANSNMRKSQPQWPDFEARLKKVFGRRVVADSQAAIDEGRGGGR